MALNAFTKICCVQKDFLRRIPHKKIPFSLVSLVSRNLATGESVKKLFPKQGVAQPPWLEDKGLLF